MSPLGDMTASRSSGGRALLDRSNFIDLSDSTFLYTGAHAPAMHVVEQAMTKAYREKSRGTFGRDVLFTAEEQTRVHLAKLAGVEPSAVGLLGDASTAWSAIANGLRWRAGDNVVVNEYEHPAVFAPFLRLRDQGLEVRVVRRDADWEMSAASILDYCDERTVAVPLSHVGYVTGLRHDLNQIGDELSRRGVAFLVDLSHSLGVVDVDMRYVAIAVCASYKWLLGPYGVGIVFWNHRLLPDFRPGSVGWRSVADIFSERRFENLNWNADATRFQMGAPALAEIAGLGASACSLLDVGTSRTETHALTLTAQAIDSLTALGLEVLTPAIPSRRAGNVAVRHMDGEAVARRLAGRGVLVWGGDGRVRASFHVMNDAADVDRFASELADDVRQHPPRNR